MVLSIVLYNYRLLEKSYFTIRIKVSEVMAKSLISKEYILTDINYSDGDVKSSVGIVEILTII